MILLDGVLHEDRVAPFDLSDRGLTLGDGLFETMTVLAGRVYRLGDHLDRLERGLSVLGFTAPRARLEADVAAMAARAPAAGAVLRLTVTRGAGARGLAPPEAPRPTVIVSLGGYDPSLVGRPVRLAVASIRRNDRSPLSRLKPLGYLDNVLALAEARQRGADDALLLNTADRVACSSVANVFAIRAGRIETPPAMDGVLAGVTRARVLALASALGIPTTVRSLATADLAAAEAVFLTNSVRLVQPVAAVDGAALASSSHPAVARLLDALAGEVRAQTGMDPRG